VRTRGYELAGYTLDFGEITKVFLRRIKYPDEKKSINHVILFEKKG